MANISSFFGGSGGSGLSTDFTKNDYGVPLPEYITCVAYKGSCTVTVCPGYTFCSGSGGFAQGGITNVKDNIFVATGVEWPYGNNDCTKVFAMAFCVNDDTGAITSNMTEFKCIFQSDSGNDRFAGEAETHVLGDGVCRVYYGHSCSSKAQVTILCTNDSFCCVTVSAPVTHNCVSQARLVYNGVPGQVLMHSGHWEDQNAYIRFCNGNVCFNGNLGSVPCLNCMFTCGNMRGSYALSPNTILLGGMFMCNGDEPCLKTALFHWNDTCNCFRMAYCKANGLGQHSTSCFSKNFVCCANPGYILANSFRVGSTWYVEGGGAQWYHEPDSQNCMRCIINKTHANICCLGFQQTGVLLTWQGSSHWNVRSKGYRGCIGEGCGTNFYGTNLDVTSNWSSNSSCIGNRPRYVTQQVNGVIGNGIARLGCAHYNCGQFGTGTGQEAYQSWSHAHNTCNLFDNPRNPLTPYPNPQFCNCHQNCCHNFLASQVVGTKWIVVMESARCYQCECVTLHSYKIMTNTCTAD